METPAINYLAFVPILVHLLLDSIQILVKKKFVKHLRSGWYTAGAGVACTLIMLMNGAHYWWSIPIAMLALHFALFSTALNIIRIIFRSLPFKFISLWYLNDPADGEVNWWDAKLALIPWYARPVLYLIVYMAGIAVLNGIDCILDSRFCWYIY